MISKKLAIFELLAKKPKNMKLCSFVGMSSRLDGCELFRDESSNGVQLTQKLAFS